MTVEVEYTGKQGSYMYNVALALDCLVNAIFNGSFRESISSRMYRLSVKGYWYAKVGKCLLDILFRPFEKDHCKSSYEAAYARGDAPALE